MNLKLVKENNYQINSEIIYKKIRINLILSEHTN